MDAWLGILLGFFVGILASIAAGVRLSYLQFRSSIAGYRVRMVAEATPLFIEAVELGSYAGRIRDKYRFSMGIILGELAFRFRDENFPENGPWPCIVNPQGDRWESFSSHVRSVSDDINVYAFVAHFPQLYFSFLFNWLYDRKLLAQLGKLTELCQQLETVVGELDAAFEGAQKDASYDSGQSAIYPNDTGDPEASIRLRNEYRKLHQIWMEWKEMVSTT